MKIPDWADEELSRNLSALIAKGESQDLEYKSEFPSNTQDLAKEIAAFASSNTGTILVGVSDSGELVGLNESDSTQKRDHIVQRLEGICKNTVKPPITPIAKFAVLQNAVVLVIIVPKGTQPIYYSNNRPYVRHLTQACPAEPHEVIERVAAYLQRNPASQVDEEEVRKSQFYSELARILAEILVIVDEVDERRINPWIDRWRSECEHAASALRDLATSQIANSDALESELRELAEKLDNIVNRRPYLGSDNGLEDEIEKAGALTQEMMDKYISAVPLSDDSADEVRELLRTTSLKLKDLHDRSETMANSGRVKELQYQASYLARPLTQVARYNIDSLGDNIKEDLREVARILHLTETMRLYCDGGRSTQAVIDRIGDCANKLAKLSERIQLTSTKK